MVKKNIKNKTLIIVESPGKVKKIQEYLGQHYIVRASYGHIRDLSPDALSINIEKDFQPIYRLLTDKKDKITSILDASGFVDEIYLASDPDREGEAIAWHLAYCLESAGKPIKRVKFNEITKSAILKAVKDPTELDQNLFDAQQARRVVDRLVGFLASDYLRNVGKGMSAGRVQSVALKMIVDRDIEIESFIPEEFWNLSYRIKQNGESVIIKYIGKIKNEQEALDVKQDLFDWKKIRVQQIDSKEKLKEPPLPFITSSLQQAASLKLGFSASTTMKLAQSLYEDGFITYMRTDSTRISDEAVKEVNNYISGLGFVLPKVTQSVNNKAAQDAHEAIRPTEVKSSPDKIFVNDDELKLYKLIWERFVASRMLPAKYSVVDVYFESGSGKKLKASGKILKEKGFLEILSDSKDSDIILPDFNINDEFTIDNNNFHLEQKFTQPNSRFNEATLVKELEKRGIGRPSTYANIVDTVRSRNYVRMESKNFVSTEIGRKIVEKLSQNFTFINTNYTAKMENQLDLIAEGELSYLDMMNEFFIPFKMECKKARYSEIKDYNIPCPNCGERTALTHGKFGFFMRCLDTINCKGTVSVDMINEEPVVRHSKNIEPGVFCPDCKSPMQRMQGKYGPYLTCETYPVCRGKRKIPYGENCDKCGSSMYLTVFGGEKKLACTGYPECKNIVDVPEGGGGEWFSPSLIEKPKTPNKVSQILRVKRKKESNV